MHTLKGEWSSNRIWLDGKELLPDRSLEVINHSPDGFFWGYDGSGPSQLALAITLELTNSYLDYQDFKHNFIAKLPQKDFERSFNLPTEDKYYAEAYK